MSGMVSATVTGGDKVLAMFDGIIARTKDASPGFRNADQVFRRLMTSQFASQGSWMSGVPWSPLTPRYAARKLRIVGNQPILVFRGTMRGSLRSITDSTVRSYSRDEGVYGTSDKKAKWHQTGTRHMPARPLIEANERTATEMLTPVIRWIFQGR